MTGGLIGEEVDVDIVLDGVGEQIDDVAVIGDGNGLPCVLCCLARAKAFCALSVISETQPCLWRVSMRE